MVNSRNEIKERVNLLVEKIVESKELNEIEEKINLAYSYILEKYSKEDINLTLREYFQNLLQQTLRDALISKIASKELPIEVMNIHKNQVQAYYHKLLQMKSEEADKVIYQEEVESQTEKIVSSNVVEKEQVNSIKENNSNATAMTHQTLPPVPLTPLPTEDTPLASVNGPNFASSQKDDNLSTKEITSDSERDIEVKRIFKQVKLERECVPSTTLRNEIENFIQDLE